MARQDSWSDEAFLNAACTAIADELDWDSLDSGRLHHASSRATMLDGGHEVIVAILSKPEH